MNGLTIRMRLTVLIIAITGVVSALGVLFGVRLLETQVREAAIDERAEMFADSGGLFLITDAVAFDNELGIAETVVDSGAISVDGGVVTEAIDLSEATILSIGDEASQMADLSVTLVRLLPDFDEAVDQIGSDGEIFVWSGFDDVVAVSVTDARLVDLRDVGTAPLVPINDLFDIGASREFFDDLDSVFFGEPAQQDGIFEFDVRQFDSTPVGLIAEVSDELDALEAIRSTLRNVVIALTLVAGLGTWLIAGRALRPVGAITDQVREITSGTLAERVPEPRSQDEVGVLARTMNTMLGRLENSDLRRRQFVSDASHELRTPVAVLRSEAEVARRAPDSTTIDDFATVVLSESKRLEGLVEDLLSLARGDESRSSTATAAIDVDEIVLAEAARTRTLTVDMSAVSAGRVIGHEDDMQRVVAHLLDNAARHGEATIAVGVQTSDDTVRVWVDDDGTGVSLEDRERIFERFIRLDDARTRDAGGAGLGLAVVFETITRMGGVIDVQQSPLGGARFQVELPAG